MAVPRKIDCPCCHESISFDSLICPHCQGDLSDVDRSRPSEFAWIGLVPSLGLLLLWAPVITEIMGRRPDSIRPMIHVMLSLMLCLSSLVLGAFLLFAGRHSRWSNPKRICALLWALLPVLTYVGIELLIHGVLGIKYSP